MVTYNFRQVYFYGDDWDGELINIPESAIFYRYYVISETQEEWYIVIPKDDFVDYEGKGCVQVRDYDFLEYKIIHLHDIKPYGEWPDVGDVGFYERMGDFFKTCYVYESIPEQYRLIDNFDFEFEKVTDPQLCATYRVKGLSGDGELSCTGVILYDPIYKKAEYAIVETELRLCDIQEGAYDPLHLKREVTHSCLKYEKAFNQVTEKLF